MVMYRYLTFIYLFVIFQQCKSILGGIKEPQIGPKQLWNETTLDKLKKDLLMNYDKYARPEEHYNTTVVFIGLSIIHVETNELKSSITIHSWLRLLWNDNKLKWNESDYGGISAARIADHEIWQPDIFLYNSDSGGEPITRYGNHHVIIYPDGKVLWVPPTKFTSYCDFDLRYWPFDTQKCFFKFGSWTHDGNELKLKHYNNYNLVDLSDLYINGSGWSIANTTAEINVKYYNCCPEPYYDATFNITIVRQYKPYRAVIITPAVVIAVLVLMQLWLPPQSKEKMIISCFITIIILMFLLYFTHTIAPSGSNTPLVVIFYSTSLFMICLSMIANILVFSVFRITQAQSLPWSIRKYLQGNIGKLLLLDWNFEEDCVSSTKKEDKVHNPIECNRSGDCFAAQGSLWKCNEQNMSIALAADRILFIIYSSIYTFLGFVYLF